MNEVNLAGFISTFAIARPGDKSITFPNSPFQIMGSWETGIYENDCAADILLELYEKFEGEASTYLDSGDISDIEPDEMANHVLAYLDLIRLLAEGAKRTKEGPFLGLLFCYRIPEPAKLKVWEKRMVDAHIGWMKRLYSSPSDRKRCSLTGDYDASSDQRLAIIVNLFERLLELADSPPPLE